jgi:anaerobic magnesium-protoporphyrin IX monomethyl ester cyclase
MNKKKLNLITMPLCGTDHPHCGIGYLTASLEQNNYEVVQRDFNLEIKELVPEEEREIFSSYSRKWSQYGEYHNFIYPIIRPYIKSFAEELALDDCRFVCFSIYYSNIYSTFLLAQEIKNINPEKIIIVGGPEASEKYIVFGYIDFLVAGEGEDALVELLNAINRGYNFSSVKGLIYKAGKRIINTGERPLVDDLDRLPFPMYQDFSKNKYNYECIPVLGSRGCVNKCSFCTETKYWKSYRSRSPENIYNEFVTQINRYGKYQSNGEPREFVFLDSLVNARVKELLKFSSLLVENKVEVPWVGKATISKNLTREALELMKKAGCKKLMFGVESGSPSVLEKMRKRFDIPTAEKLLNDVRASGINIQIYILIGFPTETDEHFYETLQFIQRNKGNIDEIVPGVGCQVEKDSDLFINREFYGIDWDSSLEKNSENWYSEHSSFDTRIKRVEDFVGFCKSKKVKVITASLEASVPQLFERVIA